MDPVASQNFVRRGFRLKGLKNRALSGGMIAETTEKIVILASIVPKPL
jgi:hypothetical protein